MRRVLIVTYDFPPIASAAAERNRQLARHLPAHGWNPVIVTPRSGTSWAVDPATAGGLPAEVEVIRTGSFEPSRALRWIKGRSGSASETGAESRITKRVREWVLVPDARAGWIPFAAGTALKRAGEMDAVLTADPSSGHVAGGLAARLAGKPWVADFHDPWSLPSYEPWEGRWRPWADSRLERWVLTRADAVVATTGWLAGLLSERGAGERVSVVRNGYDPDEYASSLPGPNGHFDLLHSGCFYGPRSPEPLLAAVAAALDQEPAMRRCLRLLVRDWHDEQNRAGLDDAVGRLGLGDVIERLPQVPRSQAVAQMSSASVLVAVTDAVEGGRGLIPLKVYEYLGAGRPVLALCPPDGETGRLVRETGGIAVEPSDISGASGAIRALYERWRSGNGDPALNRTAIEEYRWERLAGRMAGVLDQAVTRRRR